jgi:hypothetical protein
MKTEQTESRFDRLIRVTKQVLLHGGVDTSGAMFSQYDIVMEADLALAKGAILFNVVGDNSGWPRFITEIPLHKKDIFVFDQWGLYLLNTEEASDTSFTEHTFPDGRSFEEEEAAEGGIFYNSKLSLVINNFIVLTDISTDIFRMDMRDNDKKIHGISDMRYLEMPILLVGTKSIYFRLNLPRKTDWTGSTTRLRLRLRGLLVRNALVID